MEFQDMDIMFWIKFIICFILFAILPVWKFNMVDLSFTMKLMFTLAGAAGIFIALNGRSLRQR